MKVLVTGSSGLIGSEAVTRYDSAGHTVTGVDNNMRREFFGEKGDTRWNLDRLKNTTSCFTHQPIDIRDRDGIFSLFKAEKFEMIIHCAAQPSHDKAAEIPCVEFEVNAYGTHNLLEATRLYCSEAVFIHMSTNKVYGDAPNHVPLRELETRWDYERDEDYHGISEQCSIDQCLHTVFGVSKTAADLMAQEYGKFFGLKVGIFRGGCLTGSSHSGVELHGFLSYLAKAVVHGLKYTVNGYKAKQVRDNIHSDDVISAFEAYASAPRPGEVYNLGGGRDNSISMMEAIRKIETIAGRKLNWNYQDLNRTGDHICYISDLRKIRRDYPQWDVTRTIDDILGELVEAEMKTG